VLFAEAVALYLADGRRRGLRPDTLRYYRDAFGCYGRATGITELSGFDRASVRDFQDAATISPVSVRGYLRALKTFSAWLAREQFLPSDRLRGLRLPKVDEALRVAPGDEDVLALLDHAAPVVRVAIVLIIGTGLRLSDVTHLDVTDVGPDELRVRTTKNRRGRLVPLDRVLAEVLQAYIRDTGSRPTAVAGPLLVGRRGAMTPAGIRQGVERARRRSGISGAVTPHLLRHWFARDLAAHGTGERLLTARMGWAQPGLVARYAPVSEAELRADVARYAPLARLHAEGRLVGRLPVGRARATTSKRVRADGAATSVLFGRARNS
jgi:integrase/recombinase XerD